MTLEERIAFLEGVVSSLNKNSAAQTELLQKILEAQQAPKASSDDGSSLDDLDEVHNDEFSKAEARAHVSAQRGYSARADAGMSQDLSRVLAKIEQGMDLTPPGFDDPAWARATYFYWSDNPGNWPRLDGVDKPLLGFKTAFVDRVKAGKSEYVSYKETCEQFGVPSLEKIDKLRQNILSELPERAGGAFKLGRGDVASGQRALGAGPLICKPCKEGLHVACEGEEDPSLCKCRCPA